MKAFHALLARGIPVTDVERDPAMRQWLVWVGDRRIEIDDHIQTEWYDHDQLADAVLARLG